MTKHKLPVLLAVLALLAALLFGGILFSQYMAAKQDTGSGVTLDKNAVSFSTEDEPNTDPLTIRFPGYTDITLDQEDMAIPIALTNPEGNPCLFQFEVHLDGAEESILSSDWVEPGKALVGVPLPETLDAGDHKMVIQISTCSLDGQEAMNGGNVTVQLHVL